MSENYGKSGTKEINKNYPFEEGLTARTTKQTNTPNLIPEKSLLRQKDKVLIWLKIKRLV